jgi:hypothetical protein
MAEQKVPRVIGAQPTGRCFCGCHGTPKPGRFFIQTHDRKAESRIIRERFGDIATFVAWAEEHLPVLRSSEQES